METYPPTRLLMSPLEMSSVNTCEWQVMMTSRIKAELKTANKLPSPLNWPAKLWFHFLKNSTYYEKKRETDIRKCNFGPDLRWGPISVSFTSLSEDTKWAIKRSWHLNLTISHLSFPEMENYLHNLSQIKLLPEMPRCLMQEGALFFIFLGGQREPSGDRVYRFTTATVWTNWGSSARVGLLFSNTEQSDS